MQYLDLTLPTPPENLALDEALLEEAETASEPLETLRLWEPQQPMVVVGRSSHVDAEVRLDVCQSLGIPVLRRVSGGATIVAGPGCLMYAVVLSYKLRPDLRQLSQAHQHVLNLLASAIKPLVPNVHYRGTSDLALDQLKFSGNSARCRRENLLYHGTLLYDFPLDLIERCLAMPPRMPDYRERRPHGRFVTNLSLTAETLRQALKTAFDAQEVRTDWPAVETARLVTEKYSHPEWNSSL